MEEGKKCECPCHGCVGGMCSKGIMGGWCAGMGHHYLLRLILGLVILFIVFKVGVAIGEFKGEFLGGERGNYNYRMMGNTPNMMYGYYNGAAAYDASDIGTGDLGI